MKYDGVEMRENGRVAACPVCGNDEFSDDAEFCRICGMVAVNRCEGFYPDGGREYEKRVSHICQGNARYCEVCGNMTEFFKRGILKAWNGESADEAVEGTDEDSSDRADETSEYKVNQIYDDDLPF